MLIDTVVFDLDGTLLNQDEQISNLTAEVLGELEQRGIMLIYASGRSPFMASLVKNLAPGYFLCNNGAQIYDKSAIVNGQLQPSAASLLRQQTIPPQLAKKVIELARQKQLHLECNYQTHTIYEKIDFEKVNCYNNPVLRIEAQKVNWDDVDPQHFIKFATMGEEELQPFIATIDQLSSGQLQCGYSNPCYLEISNAAVDKMSSIATLLDWQSGSLSRLMAFGDSGNDQSMLDAAAIAVAMANSSPKLQIAPKFYRAPHHISSGVAHFLRGWFHLS